MINFYQLIVLTIIVILSGLEMKFLGSIRIFGTLNLFTPFLLVAFFIIRIVFTKQFAIPVLGLLLSLVYFIFFLGVVGFCINGKD